MRNGTIAGSPARSRISALASIMLVGAFLAACGDDTADEPTDTTPAPAAELTPAPPAMEAAPPAMAATPPAMEAAPPAMAATPPPAGATVALTMEDIAGNWAADAAACAIPTEITVIAADAFTGGGMNCTVNGTTPVATGLDVALTCQTAAAGVINETWTFTANATPVDAVEVNMGGDMIALVRCPPA
ncbi:MAG: hypothetical protein AB7O56_03260 [Bauldia sp.]